MALKLDSLVLFSTVPVEWALKFSLDRFPCLAGLGVELMDMFLGFVCFGCEKYNM